MKIDEHGMCDLDDEDRSYHTRAPMQKRSKIERLTMVSALLAELWAEIREEAVEQEVSELLGLAVSVQTDVNRIVWKLNQLNGEGCVHDAGH